MKNHVYLFMFFMIVSFYNSKAQTPLNEMEKEIYKAYNKSLETKKDEYIPIIKRLESFNKKGNTKYTYWIAFAKYSQAILLMNTGESDLALKTLKSGIKLLEKLDSPTSEDLTLQGTMMGISISFEPNLAAITSAKANKLYEKALKLNDNNLRTYLAIGRSDYYKPVQYGGGKKVESFLKKALSKPDKVFDDELAPSWGREEIYFYLTSYYQREGRWEEAKLFCKKGLKLYPKDERLKSLIQKLE